MVGRSMKARSKVGVNFEKLVKDFSYLPGSMIFRHNEFCTEVGSVYSLKGNHVNKLKELVKELPADICKVDEKEDEAHVLCEIALPFGTLEYRLHVDFVVRETLVGKYVELCTKPKK